MASDLVMTAEVMPLTGEEDQAAGLIFRAQDSENYYILRANALEKNVSFADSVTCFDDVTITAG